MSGSCVSELFVIVTVCAIRPHFGPVAIGTGRAAASKEKEKREKARKGGGRKLPLIADRCQTRIYVVEAILP